MTAALVQSIATSGIARRAFSLTEHFDYPTLDQLCSCGICTEWRERRNFLTQRGIFSHRRDCVCRVCKSIRKQRSAFLASENRRILFCECSWHASSMEPPELSERFMRWLTALLADRKTRSDGWWELKGAGFPINYWFVLFRHEIFGAASVTEEDLETLRMTTADRERETQRKEARRANAVRAASAALPRAAPIAFSISGIFLNVLAVSGMA